MTKHTPATPLPWAAMPAPERGFNDRASVHSPHFDRPGVVSGQGSIGEICGGDAGRDGSTQNAAYISHAANAYPKLVAALSLLVNPLAPRHAVSDAAALLRELGEGGPCVPG